MAPSRQRLERIEPKPKAVFVADSWDDPAKLLTNDAVARKVAHIRTCIENGTPLPSGYYRKGVGLDDDTLLAVEGIMHLHLGSSNSAELLYLVQYPDHVVLLELSDHGHFRTSPIGARLKSKHSVAISRKEKQVADNPLTPKRLAKRRTGPIPKKPTGRSTK